MTTLNIDNRNTQYALSWYMSARKTALRAALSFRKQLSVTDQKDMHVQYSGYFFNLLAATELFLENRTLRPNNFKEKLHSCMVFEGYQDGRENYSYIRELRNAVVHRGLNITAAAHFDGDFPMVLAVPEVHNRSGRNKYFAFDCYLLGVITKCESVIGSVMLDCLEDAGIFEMTINAEADVVEDRERIERSHVMPENVKTMALKAKFEPEWMVAAHSSAMAELREALEPFNTSRSSTV